MADEKDVYKIDLDNDDFLKKSKQTIEGNEKIGKTGQSAIGGIVSKFKGAVAIAGTLLAAYVALKKGLEAIFQAERIEIMNAQFDRLANTAGVMGNKLKKDFLAATDGMLSQADAIELANQSMVQLGKNSAKIPEIMEMARKASALTGKTVQDSFKEISKALATGSLGPLEDLGIVVDANQAIRDYAKSLGVSVDALTDVAKKQAVANAALDKSKIVLKDVTGSGGETTDNWARMVSSLENLGNTLKRVFEKVMGPVVDWFSDKIKVAADFYNTAFGSMLDDTVEKQKETGKKIAAQDQVDKDKLIAIERAQQAKLIAIRQQSLTQQLALATTEAEVNRVHQQEKLLLEQQYQSQIDLLRAEQVLKNVDNSMQIQEIERIKTQQLMLLDDELAARREAALDRYLEKSESTAQGIARAFEVGSKRAQNDLNNFGKRGKIVFDAFSANSTKALLEFGSGSKSAGEAMKGFFFGALADIAQAHGQMMLLASIFPPNPLGFAAGAGLIALAGLLRSQAGGAGGGGGAVPSGVGGTSPGFGTREETEVEPEKKAVTIQVQGNYFETEQTRTRLMEMVRESGDYTDFTLKSIGQQ